VAGGIRIWKPTSKIQGMNRIDQLFREKNKNILSVYFTAGFPRLNDTSEIIYELERAGVDQIEIGIPFSDPLADGPVIQQSSQKALENGMSLKILFEQLEKVRDNVKIPLILMGYLNPVLRYGIGSFIKKACEIGIDGLILPDLPLNEYVRSFKQQFDDAGIYNVMLITPQTNAERVRLIDQFSNGFVYMVSSASTTGSSKNIFDVHKDYFERIAEMQLRMPRLIGFGIANHESFHQACMYARGAIIGTAFIRAISEPGPLKKNIQEFIRRIR
jgi:tryptophan synthase alpha chain